MNRKVLRTISFILIFAFVSVSFSGCALVPTLNLTEEQSTLIAEYAAGKLLEYAKGHPGGLMTVEDIDLTEVNPGMKKKEEPASAEGLPGQLPAPPAGDAPQPADAAPPEEGPVPPPEQEALVDAPEDISSAPSKSIAEALGLVGGAQISYEYYEIAGTYPENSEELAFSMKAAPGKELLVVHFLLTNPGESDIEAYTDSNNFKIRMLVNGSDKLRGDVTFLDNDLMNYRGTLTPGAQVDAVLVFEVPEQTEVTSMELIIIEDGGEEKYTIM